LPLPCSALTKVLKKKETRPKTIPPPKKSKQKLAYTREKERVGRGEETKEDKRKGGCPSSLLSPPPFSYPLPPSLSLSTLSKTRPTPQALTNLYVHVIVGGKEGQERKPREGERESKPP
jgi:hypothetical protein